MAWRPARLNQDRPCFFRIVRPIAWMTSARRLPSVNARVASTDYSTPPSCCAGPRLAWLSLSKPSRPSANTRVPNKCEGQAMSCRAKLHLAHWINIVGAREPTGFVKTVTSVVSKNLTTRSTFFVQVGPAGAKSFGQSLAPKPQAPCPPPNSRLDVGNATPWRISPRRGCAALTSADSRR